MPKTYILRTLMDADATGSFEAIVTTASTSFETYFCEKRRQVEKRSCLMNLITKLRL